MKSPLLWKTLGVTLAIGFAAAGFSWVMKPQRLSMQDIPLPRPRYVASTSTKESVTLRTESQHKKSSKKSSKK